MLLVPYGVDVPHDRPPLANWGLIALTIVASAAAWLQGAELTRLDEIPGRQPGYWGGVPSFP